METLELNRRWYLGSLLDRGGFATVHAGTAEDGSPVAVKLVPKAPGASRELLFEPVSGLPNIVPILDSGQWHDNYVIVMPLAEQSQANDLAG
jgi:serine/threonine-protein kinase